MLIPRRIHQTWKSEALPPQWEPLARSWRHHHPDWEYRLWTDADNRNLIARHYPELLAVYDAYPYAIQRADAARYCILHRHGGLYVDLDVECLRLFEPLLGDHVAIVVPEPPTHSRAMKRGSTLSNAIMAAQPGHPLFADILRQLPRSRRALSHRDILASTGPIMVDRVFRQRARPDVAVLDHRTVFPYPAGSPALKAIVSGGDAALRLRLAGVLDGAYAIHYWANSWTSLVADALDNPRPHEVPGFAFFPNRDSFGADLCFAGRNVAELAAICLGKAGAVAFNTDGFIKRRLRPRWRWSHRRDRAWNEGLYVKRSVLTRPWTMILGAGHAPSGED